MVLFHSYDTSFCRVNSTEVNPKNRSEVFVNLANPMSEPLQNSSWYLEVSGKRWFILGSMHGLDAAGEFVIDQVMLPYTDGKRTSGVLDMHEKFAGCALVPPLTMRFEMRRGGVGRRAACS